MFRPLAFAVVFHLFDLWRHSEVWIDLISTWQGHFHPSHSNQRHPSHHTSAYAYRKHERHFVVSSSSSPDQFAHYSCVPLFIRNCTSLSAKLNSHLNPVYFCWMGSSTRLVWFFRIIRYSHDVGGLGLSASVNLNNIVQLKYHLYALSDEWTNY